MERRRGGDSSLNTLLKFKRKIYVDAWLMSVPGGGDFRALNWFKELH